MNYLIKSKGERHVRLVTISGIVGLLASLGTAAHAGVREVPGMVCPAGSAPATYAQATANKAAYCGVLGTWSITRLADGGSMDGSGYACGARAKDTRDLGSVLCVDNPEPAFKEVTGDTCPAGYSAASYSQALQNSREFCGALTTWSITRLAGGGSMDGSGYGCGVRSVDGRGLGSVLCLKDLPPPAPGTFREVVGTSCPAGSAPATYAQAVKHGAAFCGVLGTWTIARLADGGSMDGGGYGCGARPVDDRGMGHILCVDTPQVVEAVGQTCPSGFVAASFLQTLHYKSSFCPSLGAWSISALVDGGSMDGNGYGCGARQYDSRGFGSVLCVRNF